MYSALRRVITLSMVCLADLDHDVGHDVSQGDLCNPAFEVIPCQKNHKPAIHRHCEDLEYGPEVISSPTSPAGCALRLRHLDVTAS